MLQRFIYFFLFFICQVSFFISLQAQDDTLQSKYTRFNYPNGVICSEGILRNGLPDGIWKNYHPNGVLKSVGKRLNTLLDSVWTFYDERGLLSEKLSYQNGKKNGFYFHYSIVKQGENYVSILKSKELYVDNKREGMAWQYNLLGKLELSIPYVNDSKEGLGFGFNNDSTVVALYRYHNNQLLSIESINKLDSKGRKQGIWKTFHLDGTIKSEENYQDNVLSGYQKTFDRFGRVQTTKLFQNDSVIQLMDTIFSDPEEQFTYFSSGEIKTRGTFRNHIAIGIHREYSMQGKVIDSYLYDNNECLLGHGIIDDKGKRQGLWIGFNPETEIKFESGLYKNNERIGEWKYFFPNGSVEQIGSFVANKRNGVWQWFYESNRLRRRQEFVSDKAEGIYSEYDSTSTIISEGNFIDGKQDGNWFYKTGSIIEKGAYREGEKNGRWNAFFENNSLAFTGSFQLGLPHGKHIYYFLDGSVEHIERYSHGRKIKKWFYYNRHNQLHIIISYKNNFEDKIIYFDMNQ